jgi:hypothetical protein
MSRFDYVKYDEKTAATQAAFKQKFEELEAFIANIYPGRSVSLALTSLEETYMWIGKALRDEQIARNGTAELQEQRNNS